MVTIAVIAAAGKGRRCGGGGGDNDTNIKRAKQFTPLLNRPMIWHAVRPFFLCTQVDAIHVVVADSPAQQHTEQHLADFAAKTRVVARGGDSRARTVLNGLSNSGDDDWALVHDAARPCLRVDAVNRLLAADLGNDDGAILALPVAEALKKSGSKKAEKIAAVVSRDGVWAAQTPQLFQVARLRQAMIRFPDCADEAEAVFHDGGTVQLVRGDLDNIKVTYPSDIIVAEQLLRGRTER